MSERYGLLHIDNFAGRTITPVQIMRETPKRFEIRALVVTKIGGRNRYLQPGEMALVPKYAVKEGEQK